MTNMINLKTWLIIPALLVLLRMNAVTGKTIYVDTDAVGANDGSSWADAFNYLQDALGIASTDDEIKVAQGIYKPDSGGGNMPGDRQATFQLINGVNIKGGYAGFGEADPDVPDMNLYKSILSGDLNSDDFVLDNPQNIFSEPTRRDNSCNVVTGSYADETAVLNGFTITAGVCTSDDCNDNPRGGAGMRIDSGSPTIINCTFTDNGSFGSGVLFSCNGSTPNFVGCVFSQNLGSSPAMENIKSSPVLTNCKFEHNRNGMENRDGSTPVLTNCTFNDNVHSGMDNKDSSPVLINCTFEQNLNGMKNRDSSRMVLVACTFNNNTLYGVDNLLNNNLTLTNCIFENNGWGGMQTLSGGNITLSDCTFKENSGSAIKQGFGGSLMLNGCLFIGNSAFSGGGIDSKHSDLILYNCIFSGNAARASGGAIDSIGGKLRLYNCMFNGNSAGFGGGIQSRHDLLTLHNCIFSGNLADNMGGGIYNISSNIKLYNCILCSNSTEHHGGGIGHFGSKGKVTLNNSILWGNTPDQIDSIADASYSNIQGGFPGEGNINLNPYFVAPGYWADTNYPTIVVEPNDPNAVWVDGDYHLKSQAGRWDRESQTWVQDDVTSPCIDTGDPRSDWTAELLPNGERINMGAYGGTPQTSMSLSTVDFIADLNNDDTVGCSAKNRFFSRPDTYLFRHGRISTAFLHISKTEFLAPHPRFWQ